MADVLENSELTSLEQRTYVRRSPMIRTADLRPPLAADWRYYLMNSISR